MNYKDIAKEYNINEEVARLFEQRDLTSKEKIEDFLNPSLDKMQSYNDIPNIDNVISTIKSHIFLGSIVIFCDFDCDGLTSASIMYKAIKKYDPNANIDIVNGNRYRDEYSLSENAINIIKHKYDPTLVITLDCGISSENEITMLKDSGIEVVVIDHHENHDSKSLEVLENNYIDLKVKNGNYKFTKFSGGGIAWRVGQALLEDEFKEVLDLVTLSTVADVVPLVGENRYIVAEGIERMREGIMNSGLHTLVSSLYIPIKSMTTSDIGFQIGPCINAVGRLGSPKPVLDLFLHEERNVKKSLNHIAYELKTINEKRKRLTDNMFDTISQQINNDVNVIVVKGKIKRGVVGLIAGKINNRFEKPVIVVDSESFKGSARSIEPFSMYDNLKICEQEGILEGAGGHDMAAGLKLKEGKFNEFFNRINELAEDVDLIINPYDLELNINKIDGDFLNDMYKLAPFGHKNRHPVFKSKNVKIDNTYIIKDRHIKFNSNGIGSIAFHINHKFDLFKSGNGDIIYQPEWSSFRGKTNMNLIVRDIE